MTAEDWQRGVNGTWVIRNIERGARDHAQCTCFIPIHSPHVLYHPFQIWPVPVVLSPHIIHLLDLDVYVMVQVEVGWMAFTQNYWCTDISISSAFTV